MTKNLTWHDVIGQEKQHDYFLQTQRFVAEERGAGKVIFPKQEDVFNAFQTTQFDDVKVVILGQDPYHGPNQAHGLCFSVLPGVKTPPSLVNIYKELSQDIEGFKIPAHGYLQHWAQQGVLLLNTVLTVEQGRAHSHAKTTGWETFTDSIIEALNQHLTGVVFLLWGAHAQKKGRHIDRDKHHVLQCPHPSPLSARRGFFGCQHFSKTNQLLEKQGKPTVDWHLPLEVAHTENQATFLSV
ncbi:uracil-DNA glycosylase [Vibrio profundum]|uniref:uracil-DNA glycosylase n=1 Tax=Vibrio profundum TaxID=2910247 RepID=UPI003D1019D6